MRKNTLLLLFLCISLLLSACFNSSVNPTQPSSTIDNAPGDYTLSTSESTITTEDTISTTPEEPTHPTTSHTTAIPDESSLEIHYIDVGQADAALVICDDQTMLIDGGNSEDSSLIYSYLKQRGIDNLDYIICTHAHEDHVGGLSGALNFASVNIAYSPVEEYDSKAFQNFIKYLSHQGLSITIPHHGDSFSLGAATCQILGPVYSSDEPNNTSIVLKITYGETSFLFTGDAETEEERNIIDQGYDISCTVLKVGHHGSDTSTSYLWLRNAAPDYVVISVGKSNSYGHPTEATLGQPI